MIDFIFNMDYSLAHLISIINFNRENNLKIMENYLKLKIHLFFIIVILLLTACTGPYTISTPPRFKTQKQAQLWHHAQTFVGVPYRFGGSGRSGMDCSGLVLRLFKDVYNIKLPHSTKELVQRGYTITLGVLETGDLVFFHDGQNRTPEHVGVYLGNFRFIHASSRRGVIVSNISDPYYQKRIWGARRIRK